MRNQGGVGLSCQTLEMAERRAHLAKLGYQCRDTVPVDLLEPLGNATDVAPTGSVSLGPTSRSGWTLAELAIR